jgi:hypothetical protein
MLYDFANAMEKLTDENFWNKIIPYLKILIFY